MNSNLKPVLPADSVLARAESTPSAIALLIEKAIENQQPEAVKELRETFEMIVRMHAEQEFNKAMHLFRSTCPPVPKTQWAEMTGRNAEYSWGFWYAPLDVVEIHIKEYVDGCGFSYSFDQEVSENALVVTVLCIVRHVGGHEIVSRFAVPIGANDRISAAQNVAASNTFSKRQALISAFGVSCTDRFDQEAALAQFGMPAPQGKPEARTTTPAKKAGAVATEKQIKLIQTRGDRAGVSSRQICEKFEVESLATFSMDQVDAVLEYIEQSSTG